MPHSPHSSGHHSSTSSHSHHHPHSSTSGSRSGKPLNRLNAGEELSAKALLKASAKASDELERILRGEDAAQHRKRSRTRSPHKAVLAEEDPFLVHTVQSDASSKHTSSHHRSSKAPHRSSKHRSTVPVVDSESTSVVSESTVSEKPRRRHSSKHRHRSSSRSLSRTREKHSTSNGYRGKISSSSSRPHRTRSRSHSRNRYPDGIAPPLLAVGGGLDHELRNKFRESFEYENGYRHSSSPPMSPSRLDARAQYEHERRLRELEREEELRRREEYEYGMDPRDPRYEQFLNEYGAEDVRHPYDPYPRRDYQFDGPHGTYGTGHIMQPQDAQESFDLEEDPNQQQTIMSADMAWAGNSNVLVCSLCQGRYEEPGASTNTVIGGGKVPRYLLCGHTFCTECLNKEVTKQLDLGLATLTSSQTTGLTPLTQHLGTSCNLPCPTGHCASTPVNEHGVQSLPVNQSYLDVSKFLRSRRAAGHGLKDTGVGRGDERGEEEKIAELNAELEADAKLQSNIASSYGITTTALPCQQCSVHIAALYCQACNIRFCAACSASVHVGRALAEHVKRGLVLPLNIARARGFLGGAGTKGGMNGGIGGAPAPPALLCPTHTDQSLTLYCRTCQIPVCRDCVTPLFKGKHLPPGHDVDLLTTVLQGTSQELKQGVQATEATIARIEKHVSHAAKQVQQVGERIGEVRQELKDSFAHIRTALLKSLAEREAKLEAELLSKAKIKENRLQTYRSDLAKTLITVKAAHEEGVRVLSSQDGDVGSAPTDIFAIKALLDVRAAINAGSVQALPQLAGTAAEGVNQQDVLLRLKPRDLIRQLESSISKQGGVIASIPSEPTFVSFNAAGTSMVLSWAPANAPVEGEVLEYQLEVCELPRAWRTRLRILQPSLFPNPPGPDEDQEEEAKWDGQGPLGDNMRAAVNWLALPPGNVAVGGAEMIWKIAGGAGWAGAFTTLYSGEVCSVKHDNLNLQSAYIYRLSVKNDLGVSGYTYSTPMTLPCMHLHYGSDMDANGLVTYLGSSGGAAEWTNPAVADLIDISASSVSADSKLGDVSTLTSRMAGTFQTLNRHLSWIKIDLSRGQPFRLFVTHYTLANCGRGVGARRPLRNWALQGSQNSIDWVTLREHVKDQTLAPIPLATATWSVTQPTPEPYRYFRILQTDVNHANDHHLALGQFELYGWLVRD